MDVRKSVAVFFLAGVVGMLLGGRTYAQNSARTADSAETPLPKDVYPDSRNRFPTVKREDLDDEGKKVFDEMSRQKPLPGGTVPAGFLPTGTLQTSVRLWDPQLAKISSQLSHYRKYEIGLPDRLLEIAILVTAYEMNCQYEWTQWERFGRNPADPRHIEQSTIDLIKFNKPVVGLGEKETAIIKFGRETFGERKLSSETFADVVRLFGRKGTMDLLWLMSGYASDSVELNAFDQQLQIGQKPLLPPRTVPPVRVRSTDAVEDPLPKDIYPDSRNRFPIVKREDLSDEDKKIFDETNRGKPLPNGAVPAGFLPTGTPQPGVTLWDPKLARITDAFSHYVKYEIGLPPRLLEIVLLVTGYEMGNQYEWTQWERFGRNPADPRHIEQSTIDMIKYNKPVAGLGEKETAIIKFGRELLGQRKVSPETFAEMVRLFGRKGTLDLVWLIGSYTEAAAQLVVVDQQLQVGQKPLLPPR
jgi:4-carboxymuconolactone decarboxylase